MIEVAFLPFLQGEIPSVPIVCVLGDDQGNLGAYGLHYSLGHSGLPCPTPSGNPQNQGRDHLLGHPLLDPLPDCHPFPGEPIQSLKQGLLLGRKIFPIPLWQGLGRRKLNP